MKILGLSDEIVPFIYSAEVVEIFPEVDLVLSCGDLPAKYLEYVLTVLNVPLVYVPGNHDRDDLRVPGGIAADGEMVRVKGLRILGLGGSRRYKPRGRHQYTEWEMRMRSAKHLPELLWTTLRGRRAFDILLAHSPPYGIHDATDPAHIGFRSFRALMKRGRPRLMAHGHTHVLPNLDVTVTEYNETTVVNVYPHRLIEIPAEGNPRV